MIPSGFDVKGKYAKINKDPSAVLPYTINWADWLEGGDVIVNAVWTPPAGISAGSDTFTGTTTTVELSGGTSGQSYLIACHVTTQNGLEDTRRIEVNVINR